MSSAAVLTPMPGTPGTLSTLSPHSAWTSTTLSGPTPNFSRTSAAPIGFCLIGSSMPTLSSTSCIRSLSEETMVTTRARRREGAGIGGDQIVGLVIRPLDARDVEGVGRLAHQLELRHEIVRRVRAMRLVLVVELVAEAHARAVEDDGEVVGVGLLQQLEEHVAIAQHRADRRAVGAGQRRQRVIGAEDVAGAVDEIDVPQRSAHGGDAPGLRGRAHARPPCRAPRRAASNRGIRSCRRCRD